MDFPRFSSTCILAALLLLILPLDLQAQSRDEIWAPRPLSLGNAYTAVSGDVHVMSFNPAGTVEMGHDQLAISAGRVVGRRPEPRGGGASLFYRDASSGSTGAYGAWWTQSSVPESRRDNTYSFSYARRLYDGEWGGRVAAGLNLKYLEHASLKTPGGKIASFTADVGLMHFPTMGFSWGMAARNVTRPNLGVGTEDKLPLGVSVGAALWMRRSTLVSFDWSGQIDDQAARFVVGSGVERWTWGGRLALRGGIHSDFVSAGLGVAGPDVFGQTLRLDYAFSYPFDLNTDARRHFLSLNVRFGLAALGGQPDSRPVPPGPAASALTGEPAIDYKEWERKQKRILPLGPEDDLYVEVRGHPELDTSVRVNPWGFINLAFVGDLNVKGMRPNELALALEKIYAGFFKEPPGVTVTVKAYKSRVVYVMGSVVRPGRYSMEGQPMTVRDVILAAGLPTSRAALWRVFVVRQGENGVEYKHVNLRKILHRGELTNNIELQSGDTVYVPMGILDAVITFFARLLEPVIGITRSAVGL